MKNICTLTIISLILSGCTTEWHKTRSDAQELSAARYECENKAEEKYPVKNKIAEKTVYEPHIEKCHHDKHCKPKQVSTPTIQSYVIDVNEDTRDQWFEHCMKEKGWSSTMKIMM